MVMPQYIEGGFMVFSKIHNPHWNFSDQISWLHSVVKEKTEEDVINELLADEAKDFKESSIVEDLDSNNGCDQVLADEEEDLNISGSSDSDQENLGLTQSASTSSIHSLSDKGYVSQQIHYCLNN